MSPEESAQFVQDCEKKFASRYTENDGEYARVCKQSGASIPPLMENKPRQHGHNDSRYQRSHDQYHARHQSYQRRY